MLDFTKPVAVISDVHSNLEALNAVLADLQQRGIKTIINLGDSVGYGPDPLACVDLLQKNCAINLCGNHDYSVLHQIDGFNPVARAAVEYVRGLMTPAPDETDPHKLRRWEFLQNLQPLYEAAPFEFMHGSPRQPITEYVLPSDPELDPFKLDGIFRAMGQLCALIGHTHYPGIVEEGGESFIAVSKLTDNTYHLSGRKAIINVGSVGQPRDNDIRAGYVIIHHQQITWHRVHYEVAQTIRKINSQPKLDDNSASRLLIGK